MFCDVRDSGGEPIYIKMRYGVKVANERVALQQFKRVINFSVKHEARYVHINIIMILYSSATAVCGDFLSLMFAKRRN